MSQKEQQISYQIEQLLFQKRFRDAAALGELVFNDNSSATAPHIRAQVGVAYAEMGGSFAEKAREFFRSAYQLKYRNIIMMRSWYYLEIRQDYGIDEAEKICARVLEDQRFDEFHKSEFNSKLGQCYMIRADNLLGVKKQKGIEWLRRSIECYMEALWIGGSVDRRNTGITLNWLEKPLAKFVNISKDDIEQPFLLIFQLIERRHDVHPEGVRALVGAFSRWEIAAMTDSRYRAIGLCIKLDQKIKKSFPQLDQYIGIKTINEYFIGLKARLERLGQA